MTDSFPRQQARTRHFTLGAPRSFQVTPDGQHVLFLRSRGGSDPVTCLWALDVGSGTERLVADPAALGGDGADEPDAERARRERAREIAEGIVAFATDAAASIAVFALAGSAYAVSLRPGGSGPVRLGTRSPVIDPRPDPSGAMVAYVSNGAVRVCGLGRPGGAAGSERDRQLIGPDGAPDLTFGLAEFLAAEEMGRLRGYWWAPDGSALLVARVDESPVRRWHIADPANPDRPPAPVRYPAAGTPNADVTLLLAGLDGTTVPVQWDTDRFCYLASVRWDEHGPPLLLVQARDQRLARLLEVDTGTGHTTVLREDADERWLDIVPGVPARTPGGRIVWTTDADGARRLLVATAAELAEGSARPVTPASLQLREVLSVDGDTVLFSGWEGDPTQIGVWAWEPARLEIVTGGLPPGVHSAVRAGGTTVVTGQDMTRPGLRVQVRGPGGGEHAAPAATVRSLAEQPALPEPRIELLRAGQREIRTALLLPSWHQPGSAALPVLMDPYGGPHFQRVLAAQDAFGTSRWLAEQGFAVVVADGRGTPGRGPAWERAIAADLAGAVLQDQVEALAAAGERCADLDLSRVGIRGWSFGGYLAALAVLRRPDVFGAAVAGAPVTDWRLYDTHYTERYLGDPAGNGAAYERASLFADARQLSRPLLLIHGLADDNVVVAHTLRLSAALLAAGRPHAVLPLTGVTHLASQEEVAENLLLLQLQFLRDALGLPSQPGR
jgi:dipeptidyl-peptidase 4